MVYEGDTKVSKPVAYLKKGQTFGVSAFTASKYTHLFVCLRNFFREGRAYVCHCLCVFLGVGDYSQNDAPVDGRREGGARVAQHRR